MINIKKRMVVFLLSLPLIGVHLLRAQSNPVSETEAAVFSNRLDTSMNHGNPALLNDVFDGPSLIKRIQAQSDIAKDPAFSLGLDAGLNQMRIGSQTLMTIRHGSYRLLRSYIEKGQRHLLFRVFGDGGINYQDFTLEKIGDSVKAVDMVSYISGELLSTTFAGLVEIMVNSGKNKLSVQGEAMLKMMTYKKQGNYTDAKAVFDKMDVNLQNDKRLLLLYVLICQKVDTTVYKTALEHFSNVYPDAPNAYLLMIDLYIYEKEYNKCLKAIDRIDSLVKGDPFLDFLRGNINKRAGRLKESKACFQRVFAYDPEVWQNMQQLVDAYVKDNETDQAKSVLLKYKQTAGFNPEYIDQLYKLFPALK